MTYLLRDGNHGIGAGEELRAMHPPEYKIDHYTTIPGLGRMASQKATGRRVQGKLRVTVAYVSGTPARPRAAVREVEAKQRGVDGVLRRTTTSGDHWIAQAREKLAAAEAAHIAARAELAQVLSSAFVLGQRVPIAELRKLAAEEVAK